MKTHLEAFCQLPQRNKVGDKRFYLMYFNVVYREAVLVRTHL